LWTQQSADLNVNLVALDAGQRLAPSVNGEVDVLLVGVAGEGVVTVDGQALALAAGQALVVPKGAQRAIVAGAARFAYLTCHRRRAGLWPTNVPRPAAESASGD
jgi:quercetin dioxygenase-like cupin family protein